MSVVSSCSSHILAGGKLKVAHKIDLMEMNMAGFKLVRDFQDFWIPVAPAISGAILCYDSGRLETLVGFDEALRELLDISKHPFTDGSLRTSCYCGTSDHHDRMQVRPRGDTCRRSCSWE